MMCKVSGDTPLPELSFFLTTFLDSKNLIPRGRVNKEYCCLVLSLVLCSSIESCDVDKKVLDG